jgi:hypothetical protein
MRVALALALLSGLLAFCACAWDRPDPRTYTPQPGYPCGTAWHECDTHACCPNGASCFAGGLCEWQGCGADVVSMVCARRADAGAMRQRAPNAVPHG